MVQGGHGGQRCLNRVPPHLKKTVDYDHEIDAQAVTIIQDLLIVDDLFLARRITAEAADW